MARDEFKDYEDLLKTFEESDDAKKTQKKSGESSLNSQVEKSQTERQKKIDNFKVDINTDSTEKVKKLIRKYGVDTIAIGNGTASKESEIFIANVLKDIPEDVK
mgnify:CR=1 FL=1